MNITLTPDPRNKARFIIDIAGMCHRTSFSLDMSLEPTVRLQKVQWLLEEELRIYIQARLREYFSGLGG